MLPAQSSDHDYGDAFVRAAEAAVLVRDRYQFFVWTQLHLQRFIPHQITLCRFQAAPRAEAVVRVFNSVVLAEPLLARLLQAGSPFWHDLVQRWVHQGRKAVVVALDAASTSADEAGLCAAGFDTLVVHGHEGRNHGQPEVLFAFAARALYRGVSHCTNLELWLPYLRSIALHALVDEPGPPKAVLVRGRGLADSALLTERELQILRAVRQARRNAEIGEALGISALTVKNHLRTIMRKLGARNRAHAVAEAMTRRLIQ